MQGLGLRESKLQGSLKNPYMECLHHLYTQMCHSLIEQSSVNLERISSSACCVSWKSIPSRKIDGSHAAVIGHIPAVSVPSLLSAAGYFLTNTWYTSGRQ